MSDSVVTLLQNKKEQLTDENIKTLMDFDQLNTANNCSESTRYNQTQMLIRFISKVKKNFKDVTRDDVEKYLASRKDVKDCTVDNDKIILKKFYRWLYGMKKKEYPECVDWITLTNNYTYKKPSDMLTDDDVRRLMAKCNNLRDRCIVSLLDDSACRIGELVGIDVGDVHNDGENISIFVTGKTGPRNIGLITSSALIIELLNQSDKNPKAPLFVSYNQKTYGQRLTDNGVYEMLQTLRDRAHITKKVTPHCFRHKRLTQYAKTGRVNEAQLRIFAGWNSSSHMSSVYLHLTEEDVDASRRAIVTGKKPKPKEVEASDLLPITCPRCGKSNDSQNTYCCSCWMPLTRPNVDRDIQIINAFKSKFTRMVVDVDTVVAEYTQFRSTTEEYLQFYRTFEGEMSISVESLQQRLQWTKHRFERFINGLVETGVLKVEDGVITIQTQDGKSVFDNFELFKKML